MAAIVAPIGDSIALAFEKTAKIPRSFLCLRAFRKETSPNRCLDKLLETRDERGIREGFFGSIRFYSPRLRKKWEPLAFGMRNREPCVRHTDRSVSVFARFGLIP